MATYEYNDPVEKRVRYFDGQYLKEQDFINDQLYHINRQRRLSRLLNISGIVEGLTVEKHSNVLAVVVTPGTALDGLGRQIILGTTAVFNDLEIKPQDTGRDRGKFVLDLRKWITTSGSIDLNLFILYAEEPTDLQPEQGSEANTRFHERPELKLLAQAESEEKNHHIKLAKLTLTPSNILVDISISEYSGLRLPSPDKNNAPTLRSGGDRASNLAVLSGSLSVTGNLSVSGTGNSSFAGNVGIGMTNPASEKLEVSGNIKATGSITTSSLSVTKSDGNSLLYVRNDGNVGIGTTSPNAKLEISGGNLKVSGDISATNATLSGNVGIGAPTPGATLEVKGSTNNNTAAGLNVTDSTSKSLLYVRNDGSVGIGTTNPSGFQIVLPESSKGSSPLVSAGVTIAGGASGNASIELRNAGTGTPYIDFAQNATTTDYDARIRLTEPGKLAIEGANVGIGTTTPAANLQVRDTIGSRNNYDFSKTALLVNSQTHNGGNSPANAESVLALAREGVPNQSYGNMVDFRLSNYKNVAPVDGTQLDLYLTEGQFSPKQVMSLRANGNIDVNGRILRKGQAFSLSGRASSGQEVKVPWGTTEDWNILVAPRYGGIEEPGSEADNAVIAIYCDASELTDRTGWTVTIQFKVRWWAASGPNKTLNGEWRTQNSDGNIFSANYILIPR
jgi:hypothetical protein